MAYLEENLLPNEKILYRAKIHPIVYLPSVTLFLLIAIFTILGLYGKQLEGEESAIYQTLCCIPLFVLALMAFSTLLKAIITQLTTEFGVTNQRVIIKTGFIRRNTAELLIPKTESINIDQNVLGRVFGYGKITVIGTGGSRKAVNFISNPVYVRKVIQTIYHKIKNQA